MKTFAFVLLMSIAFTESAFCPSNTLSPQGLPLLSRSDIACPLGTHPPRSSVAVTRARREGSVNEYREVSLSSTDLEGYSVEVTYEGRMCAVMVRPNESILSALERSGAADKLCIPSFPHECRRGSCLTCAAKLGESSALSNLKRGEDGLSPVLSKAVRDAGFVLTCSSFIVGDGVKIDLAQNDKVWNAMYSSRLHGLDAETISRKARARLLRLTAEENVERWALLTEAALKKSGE